MVCLQCTLLQRVAGSAHPMLAGLASGANVCVCARMGVLLSCEHVVSGLLAMGVRSRVCAHACWFGESIALLSVYHTA